MLEKLVMHLAAMLYVGELSSVCATYLCPKEAEIIASVEHSGKQV